MTGLLVLARHGQSEGNRGNVFTGRDDLRLTDEGRTEAASIAYQLQQMRIDPDVIYTSAMQRTQDTAKIVAYQLGRTVPIISTPALNERDYGKLTGMNKDQAAAEFGPAQVIAWRRSYRQRPPGGESLCDVRQRVTGYFNDEIAPRLRDGCNVLIVGHGNCLRALAMELEDLSPFDIETFEIVTGQIIVYKIVIADLEKRAVTLVSRSQPTRSMA